MYKVILLVLMAAGAFTVAGQDQLSQQKVERLYQRGRDLIIHSNYGAAREVFADFLAHHGTHTMSDNSTAPMSLRRLGLEVRRERKRDARTLEVRKVSRDGP